MLHALATDVAPQRLADQHEACESGDDPEGGEGKRHRTHRLLGMERIGRRDPKDLGPAARRLRDRLRDGGDVGVSVAQHEALPRVELEPLGLLHVRRSQQHQRRAVGIVLRDFLDEGAHSNNGRMDQQPRLDVLLRAWAGRVLHVRSAHRGEIELLAHVVAEETRRLLVDRHLVGPVRIGKSTAGRRESILVEVATVEAPYRFEVLREVRLTIDPRRHVEAGVGPRLDDLWELRDRVQRLVSAPVEPADVDRHRRLVGRVEKTRIGRLRTSRPGDAEQRQATDQPEEQRDAGQRPPSPSHRGSSPETRESHEASPLPSRSFQPRTPPQGRGRACGSEGVPPPLVAAQNTGNTSASRRSSRANA